MSPPGHTDGNRGTSGGQNWLHQVYGRSGDSDFGLRIGSLSQTPAMGATGSDKLQAVMFDSQTEEAKLAWQAGFADWSSRYPEAGKTTPQPMANRVSRTVADATTFLTNPVPSPLHATISLELLPGTATDKDGNDVQLNVQSREGDDELFMELQSGLKMHRDRLKVLLPPKQECSAIRKTLEQAAGRIRITFYQLEKTNGSYHAIFDLVQPGVNPGNMRPQQLPRPGFAIIVRISKEEGTCSDIPLTGTVLFGGPRAGIWFNAVLFASSDTEAIRNGTALFGTVELPDDNTSGGRQNAAILEVESKSHEALADLSATALDVPMDTIFATVASESASQSDNYTLRKRESASTVSTFHDALMTTAAKMTPNSHLRPSTPNTTPAPRSPHQPNTQNNGSRGRERPADDDWNMEEAMARFRRLPAPVPKPRTEFDDMWQLKAAREATKRREMECHIRNIARNAPN
jgi:hypothetical protein